MPDPIDAVSTYIHAKDGNRPHLMRRVFTTHATLEMNAKTDAISFPSEAHGIEDLEDILVRRFADEFENIYTFAFVPPSTSAQRHFPCHWLVGMSAKEDGSVRVGCGRYDWHFTANEPHLVDRLVITIEEMCVLPETARDLVTDWLSALPYPWCTPEDIVDPMPALDGLGPVRTYLEEARCIPVEQSDAMS